MNIKVPEGRFISTVKVGEKGQIVIPKGARDLFDIKPGDTLLLLADKEQGIAIVQNEGFMNFANEIFKAQENPEEAE
ncbi:AbrB/MazE/SpoVT family DNA-binding domain-containing protein [Clostridium frigidicarnis]|uniref:Looped-hinge helix DNA binding domain-containing protein, AbrB family n=1 Tax=Clostridium frigidicarnis TaxID=84698 RepID=A0A1I0XFB5_9CLOT|nr:AbrB/MazE/SpoVT family DNA-binding domain-containing protein [Clostridium frigidicarnis]SFA99712.1 looped-hinge helix DNA binding domain-containing protein, AbrB family [Clostridium frigidicarnis]